MADGVPADLLGCIEEGDAVVRALRGDRQGKTPPGTVDARLEQAQDGARAEPAARQGEAPDGRRAWLGSITTSDCSTPSRPWSTLVR